MLEMLLTECGRLLHKAWGAAGAPQDEDVMPCGGTEVIGSLSPLNLNVSVSLCLIRCLVHRLEGQLHTDHPPWRKLQTGFHTKHHCSYLDLHPWI